MYYKVLVNKHQLGIFGHPAVDNMSISVMLTKDGHEIFASAVCEEDGDLYFYDWLQHPISQTDVVEIFSTTETDVQAPRNKYKMRNKASNKPE